MSMPGVQMPHCAPPASRNACIAGVSVASIETTSAWAGSAATAKSAIFESRMAKTVISCTLLIVL